MQRGVAIHSVLEMTSRWGRPVGRDGCMGDEAGRAAPGLKGPLQAGRRVWNQSFGNWEPWKDFEQEGDIMSFTGDKGVPSSSVEGEMVKGWSQMICGRHLQLFRQNTIQPI